MPRKSLFSGAEHRERVVGDFRWFGVFKHASESPFAWWDTWLYVPLCLLLALGCMIVALSER